MSSPKNSQILFTFFVAFALCFVSERVAEGQSQWFNLTEQPTEDRFVVTDRVWPAIHGDAVVCFWEDDKMIALSKGIDDNIVGEHAWWLSLGQTYGFQFTWYVIVYPYMYDYDGSPGTNQGAFGNVHTFRTLLDAGHDVQAHGTGSINSLNDVDYEADLVFTKNLLSGNDSQYFQLPPSDQGILAGNEVLAYAYPNGNASRFQIAANHFIGARGVIGHPNQINRTWYLNTNDGNFEPATIDRMIDDSGYTYWRGWLSYLSHTVGTGETQADKDAQYAILDRRLAYIASRGEDVWFSVFRKISKYGQERDTHTLNVLSVSDSEIRFEVSDGMHDDFFQCPLTIKVRLDGNWDSMTAIQDAESIDYRILWHGDSKYALVKAVPDGGEVALTRVDATKVADPIIEPNGGAYVNTVPIALSTITTDAEIYYTTDGSPPDEGSIPYSGVVDLDHSAVLKARAFKSGIVASDEVSAVFTVEIDYDAPMVGPVGAAGNANQVVLSFDEKVDAVTATDATNYSISPNKQVYSAEFQADGRTVVLATEGLDDGTPYTLQVNNISDLLGNQMPSAQQAGFVFLPPPDDPGLQAYWSFDEHEDSNFALDLSGNSNLGILFAATHVDGHAGGALFFDGSDAFADVGTSSFGLDATGEMTISLWFRFDAGWVGTLMQRGEYISPFMVSADYFSRIIRAGIRTSGVDYPESSASLSNGIWYHFAITYANDSCVFYINGQRDSEFTLDGSLGVGNGLPTHLGKDFIGYIDEVRIYDRALSESEVLGLFGDSIFADGFESGDESSWSSWVH